MATLVSAVTEGRRRSIRPDAKDNTWVVSVTDATDRHAGRGDDDRREAAGCRCTATAPWTYPVVTPGEPGTFTISKIDFFMAGYWELKLEPAAGLGDRRQAPPSRSASPSDAMAVGERDPDRINFDWLIRLRWAAIGGQLITIGAVHFAMGLDIPIAPLLALVGVEIGSNLACALLARRRRPRQAWLGGGDGAGRAAVLRASST